MSKKVFFFLILVAALFPPIGSYLALTTASRLKIADWREDLYLRIDQGFLRLQSLSVDISSIIRSLNRVKIKVNKNYQNIVQELEAGIFQKNLEVELKNLPEAQNFKVQFGVRIGKSEDICKYKTIGTDFGLAAIFSRLEAGTEVGVEKNFPELFCADDLLIVNFLKKRNHLSYSVFSFRNETFSRNIFLYTINDHVVLYCLIHAPEQTDAARWADELFAIDDDIYFGVFDRQADHFIFPAATRCDSRLVERIKRILTQEDADFSTGFKWFGRHVKFSTDDQGQAKKFFAVAGMPQQGLSVNEGWLLAILSFMAAIFAVTALERLFFSRGPQISLKIFIPAAFLAIVIQPFFAAWYFFEDYCHTSYIAYRNDAYEKLYNELKNVDLKTNDNFKKSVDKIRGLNSYEKIAAYLNYDDFSATDVIAEKLLKKLAEEFGHSLYSSIWFATEDGTFNAARWGMQDFIAKEATKTPVAEVFKIRFVEIIRFLSGLPPKELDDKIDKNAIKGDFARELLIKLLGPDSFYEYRKFGEFIIGLRSFFRINYIVCIPITCAGKVVAFIAWNIDAEENSRNFPENALSIEDERVTIKVLDSEQVVDSGPIQIDELQERFPRLTRLAVAAGKSRSRLRQQIIRGDERVIFDAIPANYSYFILAGRRFIKEYSLFRRELVVFIASRLAAIFPAGIFFAWLGALYFVAPLQKLTHATREINRENYQIRIDDRHPDDFASIAASFNHMAQQLEEGSILDGFVSAAVKKHISSENDVENTNVAELKRATVLFSSINGFKKIIETDNAEKVFFLLQQHLEAAVAATARFGGEIDKMIEDKVMIVFEGDSTELSSERAAILTAFAIDSYLEKMIGVGVSAGINSGITVAGIMGAEKARLSRTVVGDPVNLAARLNAEADKLGPGTILVSQQVAEQRPDGFRAEKLPISRVKGKTQSVSVFQLFVD